MDEARHQNVGVSYEGGNGPVQQLINMWKPTVP